MKNSYFGHFVTILVDFSRFIVESRLHKKSRISTFAANHFISTQFRIIPLNLARKIGRKGPMLKDTVVTRISLHNFGIFDSQYFCLAHIQSFENGSVRFVDAGCVPTFFVFNGSVGVFVSTSVGGT